MIIKYIILITLATFLAFLVYYVYRYNIEIEKRNEKLKHIIFSKTIPDNFIQEVLRYIAYDFIGKDVDINFKRKELILRRIYFVGKTLCLDIKFSLLDKENIITITSEGSVGWFDPYGWCDGYYVERKNLSLIEFSIYKDIYNIVKEGEKKNG